ncbi:MAG: malto-oligosyltrehalose trehalohydrolase [Planctomycetales bacterium]|nr:malto-oligosyltrehalose trehalohydrolase [Planctomycetales bacterium]
MTSGQPSRHRPSLAIHLELLAGPPGLTPGPANFLAHKAEWFAPIAAAGWLACSSASCEELQSADAELPCGPRWLVHSGGAGIAEWNASGNRWIELTQYRNDVRQPAGFDAALSWWLRFTGRSANELVEALGASQWAGRSESTPWPQVIISAGSNTASTAEFLRRPLAPARHYFTSSPSPAAIRDGATWFGVLPSPEPEGLRHGVAARDAGSSNFRIWAPRRKRVQVELVGASDGDARRQEPVTLTRDSDGMHIGQVPIGPEQSYRLVLDEQLSRPDPVARFLPQGVHGESRVISPHGFPWSDDDWSGVPKRELVIYELHVGAFSASGDYRGAIERLPYLRELGVTAIELLPLAQSPGRWNWGYDGVGLFAPSHNYGHPDELKALVNACHEAGLAVLLDVVYNHLGPEGNYLADFGPYFTKRHHTPWGAAFNYDGWLSDHVRRMIVENVLYWIDEFHFDGLRLDAVHFMFDDGQPTILDEVRQAVAERQASSRRHLHLIAEANMYDPTLLKVPEESYDAIWCDCLMHSIYSLGAPGVQLTYRNYDGGQDVAEALEHGYLYVGPKVQRADEQWRRERHLHGDRLRRDYMGSLVVALQTHDCVGNHPHGARLHQLTSLDFQRAAAALVLLYPAIPMIFMGEESAAEAPFRFFADFGDAGLRRAVDHGRAKEYPQHQWNGAIVPSDPRAFRYSKCDVTCPSHPDMLDWYRQLLQLRRRGLQDGWLDAERMTVHCQPESGLFSLCYESPELGGQWAIVVRLCRPDAVAESPLLELSSLPLADRQSWQVLLRSHPGEGDARGLLPNTAIVLGSQLKTSS